MSYPEIQLQALSCRSPENSWQLNTILQRIETSTEHTLTVLPEYLLSDGPLFTFKGIPLTHPFITMLENFTYATNTNLVAGTVLDEGGRKTLSALLVTPQGISGRYDKHNPTPFEQQSGIQPGDTPYQIFSLTSGMKISIISCFDVYQEDPEIRRWLRDLKTNAPHVVAHPRGFDLDDDHSGTGKLATNWSRHVQDLAASTRTYWAAATGILQEQLGSVSEVISFEGVLLDQDYHGGSLTHATIDLNLLERYQRGEYVSSIVPLFF